MSSIREEILREEEPIVENYSNPVIEERRSFNFNILKTETGGGTVQDYVESPLNFNNSLAVARILRGVTGFLGSLNYALVDIFIGILEYAKSKKEVLKSE